MIADDTTTHCLCFNQKKNVKSVNYILRGISSYYGDYTTAKIIY